MTLPGLRPPVLVGVFAVAFAADLATKEWAVAGGRDVLYHDAASRLPLRVLLGVVTVTAAFAIDRVARLRGLAPQWGAWIGCALLVSGTLANGVSALLWRQGIPDFIDVGGGWVWNVADFEIAIGLAGGLLSVAVSAALAYGATVAARR